MLLIFNQKTRLAVSVLQEAISPKVVGEFKSECNNNRSPTVVGELKILKGKELTAYEALLDEIVREIEQHRIKAARGLNATQMQLHFSPGATIVGTQRTGISYHLSIFPLPVLSKFNHCLRKII